MPTATETSQARLEISLGDAHHTDELRHVGAQAHRKLFERPELIMYSSGSHSVSRTGSPMMRTDHVVESSTELVLPYRTRHQQSLPLHE